MASGTQHLRRDNVVPLFMGASNKNMPPDVCSAEIFKCLPFIPEILHAQKHTRE